ncbi:C4-dicarboxylate transporter DcuC [Edwardsiella piscicida]|uniref:C4-dicarboxylate transporter n=1 Tax=Edwardsiella tarda (strain FL6-60) TaxID=718251 RepID=A0A0H3DPV9_EDWTF|nr:C4-dicarboxylate transporter DcuC [Edwardsiella piscicida]ADM41380.1 C4-dicarboxylate transporter [Edwardsiella tarda FL6-60]EKS7791787.1 C4-dicarboxylate transporter DcuC [Edwardsiella piscicida]ELM3657878.1 C4-dicarboxylate transporter DcuC [Edwardsiella piscicida]QBB11173.1 C4-dicarboxylate ABC transporter [Edwardsiella piscicida]UCQ15904.1 C4-dicarboxylate transporter DcuC [Edwardsiella piscicida]
MSLLIALCAVLFAGRLILKNYNPQAVLLLSGLVMMAIAVFTNDATFINKSTGWVGFDLLEYINQLFQKMGGGLGLQIMLIGGFAMYMSAIGASQALVRVTARPLQRLNSPYLLLGIAFILGQTLSLFITSATGLSLLLMATLYPVLTRLGCSRAAAAAVLASTCAIEFGPGSGNSIMAAQTSGVDITEYFIHQQLPVAVLTILAVALLHILVQRYFDRRDGAMAEEVSLDQEKLQETQSDAPLHYVLLPMLPLFFMLTFSKLGVGTIVINMNTAVLISVALSMLCEYLRFRAAKPVMAGLSVVFSNMGKVFATVVTLIVAGQTFAEGLKSIGAVHDLLDLASNAGFGSGVVVLLMALLTFTIAALMGSGNAAFFSFAPMLPDIAKRVGGSTAEMILPVQISAGMGRTISPIAGVIIAVAGIAGISQVDIVRRTLIPMLGGWCFMLLLTFYRSGQLLSVLPFIALLVVIMVGAVYAMARKKRSAAQSNAG